MVIQSSPADLKEGDVAILTCETSMSNPRSSVTWWLDGYVQPAYQNHTIRGPGPGEQWSTISKLRITTTRKTDGQIYTCQGFAEAIPQSVHNAITLHVKCKYSRKNKLVN